MDNHEPVEDVIAALGYLCLGTRFKRLGERLQADTVSIVSAQSGSVPPSQLPFLAAIDRLGPLTVGEMAQAIGITQPGATKTLLHLAKLGLVDMSQSREDRRVRVTTLTATGQDLVAQSKASVWKQVDAAARELCKGLSGTLLDQLDTIEQRLAEKPLREWGKP